MLTHGSLFSGIGGFDLGFDRAGIPARWQCEINPAARKVLAYHWPDVPCRDDVTALDGADLAPVDVVTFGSPCQDLSVAGTRAGLDGDRSGLFFAAIRVIREMRDATARTAMGGGIPRPRWAVWENVPGAFSSNAGRDFGAVLDALADLGALDVAWRTLDARWFGVPQRRRRVFVVADFGGESAAEILALGEGVQGRARPGRAEGQVVGALTASSVGGGGASDALAGHLIPCLTDPARMDDQSTGQLVPQTFAWQTTGTARTDIHDRPGTARALTANQTLAVAFNARQDPDSGPVVGALDTDGSTHAVALAVRGREGGAQLEVGGPVANAVRAGDGGSSRQPLVFDRAQVTHPDNRSNPQPGDPAPTLAAGSELTVATPGLVRRLTPTECERLQGFPDGWTVPAGADTPRYRTLGNAVCVNVAEWIARNLDRVAGKGTEG